MFSASLMSILFSSCLFCSLRQRMRFSSWMRIGLRLMIFSNYHRRDRSKSTCLWCFLINSVNSFMNSSRTYIMTCSQSSLLMRKPVFSWFRWWISLSLAYNSSYRSFLIFCSSLHSRVRYSIIYLNYFFNYSSLSDLDATTRRLVFLFYNSRSKSYIFFM